MRIYSVSEAVGPAWERTRLVLRTGRWGTNFKMAFVVVLAEMGSLLLLPVQSLLPRTLLHEPAATPGAMQLVAGFNLVFGLIFMAVYAMLFYFGSRMQLTFFDLVLTRSYAVTPLWARHRQSTWRWMAVKLIPSALVAAGMVPFLIFFTRLQQALVVHPGIGAQTGAPMQVAVFRHMFVAMLGSSMLYLLLVGPALLLYSHLRDFLMPYLAIDQLRAGAAFQRWLLLWRTYPGQMLGYVFFRLLLLFGVLIGFYFAIFFAVGIPVVLAVLLGVGIKLAIHGTAGTVLVAVYAVLAGLLALAWYLAVLLFGGATFATFFQCYSLYFLGGRDPRIGALLEPETAVPVWTPPPSIPRDDSPSGPDFPADPALA